MKKVGRGCPLVKLSQIGLLVLAVLVLLLPHCAISSAGDLAGQEQMAPVNPAFLRYIQKQSAREALGGLNSADFNTGDQEDEDYGFVPPLLDLSDIKNTDSSFGSGASASLPSSFDWRTRQAVTSIKDQGAAGACWAFASLSSLESRIEIVDGEEFDLSELNLLAGVDPAWANYHSRRSSVGGNNLLAGDTLTKLGTRPESAQPYGDPEEAEKTVNKAVCDTSTPPLQKLTGFRLVSAFGTSSAEITTIKNAIYTYGPVTASFCFYQAHLSEDNLYEYPSCTADSNHMVSLIGWDDVITHVSDGGKGAWIVKNSFGTEWGDGGYFYLCYGDGNLQEVASYHGSAGYENYDASEQMYFWDEAGPVSKYGNVTDSAYWMRSVFTAENDKPLKAVAFWTTSDNAAYQVYVLDAGDQFLANLSGTCDEMGYYTLPLPESVPLSTGQQFKIDVKMTTPGYPYPLMIEKVYYTYITPPIQSNATFVRHTDGDAWTDSSTPGLGFNVCLRAITGYQAPSLTTGAATAVGITSATLNGTLTAKGDSSLITACFRYGASTGYENQTQPVDLAATGDFSFTIPSTEPLTPGVTYHYQAVARGDYAGAAPAYGSVVTFTTASASAPAVTTYTAQKIGYTGATLRGKLKRPGSAERVILFFEYGRDKNYGLSTIPAELQSSGIFMSEIGGLEAGTTYHYRLAAKGDYPLAPSVYGPDVSFKTRPYVRPSFTSSAAGKITKAGALLKGRLNNLGSATEVSIYCEYGPDAMYEYQTQLSTWNMTGPFSLTLEGLNAATTYYYRIVARGDYPGAPPVYGVKQRFKTMEISAPGIAFASATVGKGTVKLKARLTKMGSSLEPVSVHFEYWSPADGIHHSTAAWEMTGTGYFETVLAVPAELQSGTIYFFQAIASGDGATASAAKKFTTRP